MNMIFFFKLRLFLLLIFVLQLTLCDIAVVRLTAEKKVNDCKENECSVHEQYFDSAWCSPPLTYVRSFKGSVLQQVTADLHGTWGCGGSNGSGNSTVILALLNEDEIAQDEVGPECHCLNCAAVVRLVSLSSKQEFEDYQYGGNQSFSLFAVPDVCVNQVTLYLNYSAPFSPLHNTVALSFVEIGLIAGGVLLLVVALFSFVAYVGCDRLGRRRYAQLVSIDDDGNTLVESVNVDDIRLRQRIGKGSFAEVYRAYWRGSEIAVKKLPSVSQSDDRQRQDFEREAQLMSRLRHPNVLMYLGTCFVPPDLWILTEYMGQGSLYRLIHAQRLDLTWDVVLSMLLDAARGVAYLHGSKPSVMHRDLKSHNVLVSESWHAKICDFGLSRLFSEGNTMTACGTPCWTAPEVLRNHRYSTKADVYSFGIIIWECVTRRDPYGNMPPFQVVYAVATEKARPPLPRDCPATVASLMRQCWAEDPEQRPEYEEIVDRLSDIALLIGGGITNAAFPDPLPLTPRSKSKPATQSRTQKGATSGIAHGKLPFSNKSSSHLYEMSETKTIKIRGLDVCFPYNPYTPQKVFMEKVIEALQDGKNAMLESPTGTGKTLALLCSALAWQDAEAQKALSTTSSSARGAAAPQSFGNVRPGVVRIIYASRTHSQLTQVAAELRKTAYSPRVSLLGSRAQLCVNEKVRGKGASINALCRSLVASRSCYPYLKATGAAEDDVFKGIADIEDLVRTGQEHSACPYYALRESSSRAELLLMPYNYLLDPQVRRQMSVDISDCVVILDEAHNVPNVCESAASFELNAADIARVATDLGHAAALKEKEEKTTSGGGSTVTPEIKSEHFLTVKKRVLDFEQKIEEVLCSTSNSCTLTAPNVGEVVLPGVEIVQLLAPLLFAEPPAGALSAMSAEKRDSILKEAQKAAEEVVLVLDEAASLLEQEAEKRMHGSSASAALSLAKVSAALRCSFPTYIERQSLVRVSNVSALRRSEPPKSSSGGALDASRYSVYNVHLARAEPEAQRSALDSVRRRKPAAVTSELKPPVLSFLCLSPSLGMQSLVAMGLRCIVFTSGTLAPLSDLEMELGIDFAIKLENPHVVPKKNIFAGVFSRAPDGITALDSTYKNRSNEDYIKGLGQFVVNVARVVPGGLLVFFQSYSALQSCLNVWNAESEGSSVVSQLEKHKHIVIEQKGNAAFKEAVDSFNENVDKSGSILLGILRGKASEGIDFADARGRCVIITGLPFPSLKANTVHCKKQLIAKMHGNEAAQTWYRAEATRAVNQAIGRVIRHHNDYGAILFAENRFEREAFRNLLSVWLRSSLRNFSSFQAFVRPIVLFFKERNAEYLIREDQKKQNESQARMNEQETQSSFSSLSTFDLRAPSSNVLSQKRYSADVLKLRPASRSLSLVDALSVVPRNVSRSSSRNSPASSKRRFATSVAPQSTTNSAAEPGAAHPATSDSKSSDEKRRAAREERVKTFLRNAKNALSNAEFKELREFLLKFKKKEINASELCNYALNLFHLPARAKLLRGFVSFVPENVRGNFSKIVDEKIATCLFQHPSSYDDSSFPSSDAPASTRLRALVDGEANYEKRFERGHSEHPSSHTDTAKKGKRELNDSAQWSSSQGELPTCCICRTHKLKKPHRNRECGHVMCYECWEKWLAERLLCPVCQKSARLKTLQPVYF